MAVVVTDGQSGDNKINPEKCLLPKSNNINQDIDGADDDALDSKKNAVTDRLRRRNDDRVDGLNQRRADLEKVRIVAETSDHFREQFSVYRTQIEEGLTASNSSDDVSVQTQNLDGLTLSLQKMQKFLTDSISFLPPYSIQSAQEIINQLKEAIEDRRAVSAPKKKFAFKGGKKKVAAPEISETDGAFVKTSSTSKIPDLAPEAGLTDSDACGFHNRTDEILTISTADLCGKRVMLAALTRCTVYLHGAMTALHADGLTDCRVSCGPVAGATFISDCTDCKFSVACHQLRVHRTRDTAFYLHVTSRAIIEDCAGITTAPYVASYEGLGAQLDAAGLDPARNSWDQLDDFNWLASNEPSPNWSVLSVDRRIKWSD